MGYRGDIDGERARWRVRQSDYYYTTTTTTTTTTPPPPPPPPPTTTTTTTTTTTPVSGPRVSAVFISSIYLGFVASKNEPMCVCVEA